MKTRTIAVIAGTLGLVGLTGVWVIESADDSGRGNVAEAATDYLETFDSEASLDTLDFFVSNGRDFTFRPESWPGDHAAGAPCGAPTTSRTVHWPDPPGDEFTKTTDAGEAAYWCAPGGAGTGHLMTAFKTGGYAHLDFSPKQMFTDVRKVCWDQNVTNLGNRKWTQLTIVPKALDDINTPRLDYTHPGFRIGGPAFWGLSLENDGFMFSTTQGNAQVFTGEDRIFDEGWQNDTSVSDKAKRVTTCLTDLRNGSIEVSQERWDDSVDVIELTGAFPAGPVRVIWQDVSYNPDKAVGESPPTVSNSYTWHWDNLFVSTSPNAAPPPGGGGGEPITPPPPSVPPSAAGEFDSLPPARLLDTRTGGSTVDGKFVRTGAIASGQVLELQVAGRGGVSDTARAAALNVTSVAPARPGYLTLYPCGGTTPLSSNVNYLGGDVVANLVVVPLDASGRACIFASSTVDVVVDTAGFFPAGSNYSALTPRRFLDTRPGESTFDGTAEGAGRAAADAIVSVPVAGRGGIPADAEAVVVNLAAVDPRASGFATAFPCGEDPPHASNLNYLRGRTVSTSAVVRVGAGGAICLYTLASADLVLDVQGSFTDEQAFGSFSPFRLLDTRPGEPTGDGQQAGTGRATSGSVTEITVEGRAGVPTSAGAVSLSIAVVNAGGPGYATVYPCGQSVPTASNVNYGAGGVVANAVLARIGAGGKVCVFTLTAADLVVDANGWFPE